LIKKKIMIFPALRLSQIIMWTISNEQIINIHRHVACLKNKHKKKLDFKLSLNYILGD